MQVRESSKDGPAGVYSEAGELLFAPEQCVAAVLTDRTLIAWCAPRAGGDRGQARGGPWFVEKYQIPSDDRTKTEWTFVGGYEIRNRNMMGWCWASRIKAPKKYKFRIVVIEGRSEDFRDSIHVVLHDDGRFSETTSLEAAQCLLAQPQAELERWSGDYGARILGDPIPHWGLVHDAFYAIWISPDSTVPRASSLGSPRAEGTRRRLFPFGERERLTLSNVGADPAWLREQPELAPVRDLTIYAPYVSKALFESASLWLPWFRKRPLETLAFGQGGEHRPFLLLSWRGEELVGTLTYATEQLRNRTQEAIDGFLTEHPDPLVDIVHVLGGGLRTKGFASRSEDAADPAKIAALVNGVRATLEGEVLHLKRPSYQSYHSGNPFPAEALEPALERHWIGNPKELRAELRVTPTQLDAFWPASASRGVEVLHLQTEKNVWYRRTASGWCSQDGFLELIGSSWLEALPDPDAKRIRLHLDVFGIKTEVLLEATKKLLWQGYDVCIGPSELPHARVRRASDFVSDSPKPPLPPLGKLVELVVRGHGAGLFRVKYLKRTARLECTSAQAVEAPTPHTLARVTALHPPPGPVREASFQVPLVSLALCLNEWLELSVTRDELELRELEVVRFTTKTKGAPTSELRYADGGVDARIALKHLGTPPEFGLDVVRGLPDGTFKTLRVEHEAPPAPALRTLFERLCSSEVDWAQGQ